MCFVTLMGLYDGKKCVAGRQCGAADIGLYAEAYGSRGFQPNYSRFVGYKEDVLTRTVGRPDSIYYDDYGRRYMVYNTFSMDNSGPRFGSYRCRTMFLTGRGMVKASFFNEEECIRER